jgi:hypothetical protein
MRFNPTSAGVHSFTSFTVLLYYIKKKAVVSSSRKMFLATNGKVLLATYFLI